MGERGSERSCSEEALRPLSARPSLPPGARCGPPPPRPQLNPRKVHGRGSLGPEHPPSSPRRARGKGGPPWPGPIQPPAQRGPGRASWFLHFATFRVWLERPEPLNGGVGDVLDSGPISRSEAQDFYHALDFEVTFTSLLTSLSLRSLISEVGSPDPPWEGAEPKTNGAGRHATLRQQAHSQDTEHTQGHAPCPCR